MIFYIQMNFVIFTCAYFGYLSPKQIFPKPAAVIPRSDNIGQSETQDHRFGPFQSFLPFEYLLLNQQLPKTIRILLFEIFGLFPIHISETPSLFSLLLLRAVHIRASAANFVHRIRWDINISSYFMVFCECLQTSFDITLVPGTKVNYGDVAGMAFNYLTQLECKALLVSILLHMFKNRTWTYYLFTPAIPISPSSVDNIYLEEMIQLRLDRFEQS